MRIVVISAAVALSLCGCTGSRDTADQTETSQFIATVPTPTAPLTAADTSTTTVQSTGSEAETTTTVEPSTSSIDAPTTSIAPRPVTYAYPIDLRAQSSYAREHHDYPAADIFAACGSEVRSPVDGLVQEVSRIDVWNARTDRVEDRGGLSVAIVGDDGVRYYGSHFRSIEDAVAPGTRVRSGARLGTVGQSGNAKGTGCHLHFGISRPCGPGDVAIRRGEIWPWPYLDSWKAGGQRSPVSDLPTEACAKPGGA